MHLLHYHVPPAWIEQMDDETMVGWVWASQLFSGEYTWDNMAGKPVEKPRDKK